MAKKKKIQNSNLLVEIGSEELPLAALDTIYSHLQGIAAEKLKQFRLGFASIRVEATPRRTVLFVNTLSPRQNDDLLELQGPSIEKAYDAEGKPTKALDGFLKSKQAKAKDLEIKDTPRGKFVLLKKKVIGKPAQAVLPSLLKEIIEAIPFSKLMRWESTHFKFPRPIRWIVVLLGNKTVSLKLAGIKSGSQSFGHRFLAPKPFNLRQAAWKLYEQALKKAHVSLSLQHKEGVIRKALAERYHQKNIDEELVHLAAQLVEEPFMLQGSFSKTYLELPPEVLASCMKKNQKIFACYDPRGRLANKFVAVLNGKRSNPARIRAGYENVLDSRLRDARYFYDADTKERLDSKLPLLEQVVYLGKLGSLLDKTERLQKLSESFATFLGRDDIRGELVRVARLSKIDLMTQLVYEFPDLQGIVGREYALEAGEKEDVSKAVGTQYLPKNLGESYQSLKKAMTPLGAMFGILDRIDHLVGAFASGREPTGSQDPFALRRAGGSVAKLIRAFGFHFSLDEFLQKNIDLYKTQGFLSINDSEAQDLALKVKNFLKERVNFELKVKTGARASEILSAVFQSSFDDIADVFERFQVLNRFSDDDPDSFRKTGKVVERTSNILKGIQGDIRAVDPALFQENPEKELFRLLETEAGEFQESLRKKDYEKATRLFGQIFYDPIHAFFDQVMVNVEDQAVRANRQALIKQINNLYTDRIADLSVLSRID